MGLTSRCFPTERSSRRPFLIEILESRQLLTTLYVDPGAPGAAHNGQFWSSAFLTIQDALAAAVSSDQILVAAGTYTPPSTLQLPSGIALQGGYAGNSNPSARDISLYPSIISGSDQHQVLAATDTASGTTLDGFTIQDGKATTQGGGIGILRGLLTIQNCTFKSDIATDGGALYADNTSLTLTNTTFTHNLNEQSNALTGDYTVTHGSAVYSSHSALQVNSCTFDSNVGSMGSAIYNNASTASIINSTFTNNEAYNTKETSIVYIVAGSGGAIYNSASTVTIYGSTFNENSCPDSLGSSALGGAIYNEYNSPLTVINSTFADNSADQGGAICGDSITLLNCTIDSNGANFFGRSISCISHAESISITNCILWGPSTGQVSDGGSSTMNITYSDIRGGYAGAGNIDQTPDFVAEVNAGPDNVWGTSDDYWGDLHFQYASPCIDAGNSAALPTTITTDKDGNPRAIHDPFVPRTGLGPIVDMGALEFVSPNSLLMFGQQPANAGAGAYIAPEVTVEVVDSSGHILAGDNSAVTLSILNGPAGIRLVGAVTANTINGIATFDKLSIQESGRYILQAADIGDNTTSIASRSFNILGSQPTFAAKPTGSTAGQGPLVVVDLMDASGQLATNDDSIVTLSISSEPQGATLGGITTVSAVNGVATFNDLQLTKAGIYSLQATDAGMTAGTDSFTVAPDASTTHLVLLQQPADGAIVAKNLYPGFQFAVEDQFGNVMTTDHSTIKLTITNGPGAFRGKTSVTDTLGTATFRNLTFNRAGTYALQAADGSLRDTSPVLINDTIIPEPTTLAVPLVARDYIFNQTITLRQVLKSQNFIPFTGLVTLTDEKADILATATLSAAGAYRMVVINIAPGTYTCTVNYPGDVNHAAATSSNFTLQINTAQTSTTLKASPSLLHSGQSLTLSAAVKSPYAKDTPPTGTITFMDAGTLLGSVALDRNSTAALTIPVTKPGAHVFTAVFTGDSNFKPSTSHAAARTVGNAAAIAVVTAPYSRLTVSQDQTITQMGGLFL